MNQQYLGAQNVLQQLAHWSPDVPLSYDNANMRTELREFFSWGVDWTYHFESWLQTLQWDANGAKPLPDEVGVTWFELALSFMLFTERWIPCLRSDNNSETSVVFPANNEHAETLEYQATDAAVSFAAMWTQYHSLHLDVGPVPVKRGLQRSLAVLGASCRSSGLSPRPAFPHHQQVVQRSAEMMKGRTSYKFSLTMPMELNQNGMVPTIPWEFSKSHLKIGQARARYLKRVLCD